MQEEDLFVFRSDNEERLAIAERNKQAAASILSQAGISEDNPLYNQYYAHTWQMCIMPVDMADMTSKLNRCL